jgi:2-polyprenyl-3-methyl-5-hydroxy-6-metoxy-1,4-benzoquinol methylase
MRYTIAGQEIRSENAAKPHSSASRWLLKWIRSLSPRVDCLDLGCGKLRYTVPLARRTKSVAAVDSQVQVERVQRLSRETCSVRDYVRRYLPNTKVYGSEEKGWKLQRYDVVICTNVLSAIPCRNTRKKLLKGARQCLKSSGHFLLTTQFRNSHFKSWKTNPKARPYMDGFIVSSRRGTSFYGLLDAKDLEALCCACGLHIEKSGHVGELAYVLATRNGVKTSKS